MGFDKLKDFTDTRGLFTILLSLIMVTGNLAVAQNSLRENSSYKTKNKTGVINSEELQALTDKGQTIQLNDGSSSFPSFNGQRVVVSPTGLVDIPNKNGTSTVLGQLSQSALAEFSQNQNKASGGSICGMRHALIPQNVNMCTGFDESECFRQRNLKATCTCECTGDCVGHTENYGFATVGCSYTPSIFGGTCAVGAMSPSSHNSCRNFCASQSGICKIQQRQKRTQPAPEPITCPVVSREEVQNLCVSAACAYLLWEAGQWVCFSVLTGNPVTGAACTIACP
jgi:hypothetical protein